MITKSLKNKSRLLTLLFFFISLSLNAEGLRTGTFKSSLSIHGTSSLHDWESVVNQVTGEFVLNNDQIESLVLSVPVLSIKSKDEEKLMDKKTYEALKSNKNPLITFKLTQPAKPIISESTAELTLTGDLTIAGITKKITFKSNGIKNGATYIFRGNIPLKMSDFKIDPPTAMLGLIKTGDQINLKFNVTIPNP